MKFPLRIKLFSLVTLVVTAVMATVTYVYTVGQIADRRRGVAAEVERIARSIATLETVERQDWAGYQSYISQLMLHNRDLVYIAVYDERRALQAWGLNVDLIDAGSEPVDRQGRARIVRELDRGAVASGSRDALLVHRVDIVDGPRVLGSVHVGVSLLGLELEMRRGIRQNIALALSFVVVFGLVAFFLSRRLTRPIERLAEAMEGIAAGDLQQRVVPQTRDELASLAITFNGMVDDLRERQIIERLGRELGRVFQRERLVDVIGRRVRAAVGASSVGLFVRDPRRPGIHVECRESGTGAGREMELDEECLSWLRASGEGFGAEEAPPRVQSLLGAAGIGPADRVIPMVVQDRLFGLLALGPPLSSGFDARLRHLAATLAGQAAPALENALLYEELRDQDRLKSELAIARDVQRRLLPAAIPLVEGLVLDAECRPATEVGGDYYDFYGLGDGCLGVVIADVSGKGMSASLYMAEIKGMMLSLVDRHRSPREVLSRLNRQLYPSLDRRIFVSVLYGVIDVAQRQLLLARAGHSPVLRLGANGASSWISPPGIAVGLDRGDLFDEVLEECRIDMEAGDALVLFTDGVTDAMSPRGEAFGARRLEECAKVASAQGPAGVRAALLDDIERFVAGAQPFDDLTIVVVGRPPAGPGPRVELRRSEYVFGSRSSPDRSRTEGPSCGSGRSMNR